MCPVVLWVVLSDSAVSFTSSWEAENVFSCVSPGFHVFVSSFLFLDSFTSILSSEHTLPHYDGWPLLEDSAQPPNEQKNI